ncbi:hypothetical protein BASA81_003095 [Batrachochytrium salamandrivorans]|nr:hypothetical protein BASA81_003095 [Batrachochytrium salamandrivorans]
MTNRGRLSPGRANRQVEMGRLESQYARIALEYRSSGLLFCGVTISGLRSPLLPLLLPGAIETLQRRHPILRCTLNQHHKQLVFCEHALLPIPVEQYTRSGEYSWKSIWENFFESQDAKLGDKVWRVCVVGAGTEGEPLELILAMHQCACDGESLSSLLHELLTLLGGNGNDGGIEGDGPWDGPWDVDMDEEQECRRLVPNSVNYLTHNLASLAWFCKPLLVGMPLVTGAQKLLSGAKQAIHTSKTHHRMHELSANELFELQRECVVQGVSVASAVSGAFLCAQRRAASITATSSSSFYATLAWTFSTREMFHVPTSQSLSPHVGTMFTSLRVGGNKDMWAVALGIERWRTKTTQVDQSFYTKHTTEFTSLLPTGLSLVRPANVGVLVLPPIIHQQYGPELVVERSVFAQNHRHIASPLLCVNGMVHGKLSLTVCAAKPQLDPRMLDHTMDLALISLTTTTSKSKL